MKNIIISIIILNIVIWLLFAFLTLEINPLLWEKSMRETYVVVFIFSNIIISIFSLFNSSLESDYREIEKQNDFADKFENM